MFSLYNILTIARFEVKTLFRSWFFRVFAILTLGILGFMNILWFTDAIEKLPWGLRAIPGSVPYLNMMFYNIAQAIIAVFMASDFLKRDYKLNTTEVIYMRNMANGDYVLGKTLGILHVFVSLNLVLYIFAIVVNLIFSDVPVYWNAYLTYFLLMSLPSLVFIVGLSFISMILVRNQALTFILILGYVAISLFFLTNKANYLFDYMAWYIPLSFSDFVGFAELGPVITQRLIYLALGLAFIFITIFSIKRLPQSPFLTKASVVFAIVLFAGAGYLGVTYVADFNSIKSTRAEMVSLNDELKSLPMVSVKKCDLDVEHKAHGLEVTAQMDLQNESGGKVDKLVFSLNPGFSVQAVKLDGADVKFEREHHILTADVTNGLAAASSVKMQVEYSGNISALSSYLDVLEEQEEKINNVGPYKLPKEFGFVTPNYVLLTQENLWYPIPGTTHGSEIFPKWKKDFFDFTVNVKTKEDLTVITQGDQVSETNGEFSFISSQPLPQLSLVIGEYSKRSIVVDSVEYSLYTHPKHNYFEPYFTEISDTLASLIRDEKQEVETLLDVDYPFPRLSIIEVPSQYFTYTRRLGAVEERVQPEQMFLPENGASLNNVDFKRSQHYYERRSRDRNQEVSKKEMQTSMMRRFLSEMRGDTRRRRGGDTGANFEITYSVVPFYYNYVTHLEAREYPLLSTAFESFLNSTLSEEESPWARFFSGLSESEKANLLLRDNSLADLLKNEEHFDQINHVIQVKSDFIFKKLVGIIGDEEFSQFLAELLTENQFKSIQMDDFLGLVKDRFGIDFLSWLEPWKNDTNLPGLFITNVTTYQVLDGNMTRYQIKFTLINEKDVDGLVYCEFRAGGGGPGRGGPPPVAEQRVVLMEPNQAKEIYILLDDEPRGMTINTVLAENLPAMFFERIRDVELNKNAVPIEGEKILDELPPFTMPGEYIVDNEEAGFTFSSGEHKSMLQKMLNIQNDDEEEYTPFRFYRPPTEWRKTTFDNFYGRYVHSAYFIRSGSGDKTATWTTNLKSSGQYEVYAYNPNIQMRFGRGRDRGRGGNTVGELHFKVYHDDGVEEVLLDTPNAEEGWNLLGAFYLSAGEAKVEITNESNERLVIADAVKWVKK